MMLPKAYVSHEIDRRLRLRVPSKKQDRSYFSEVREQLEHCDAVEAVRVNAVTASVLIEHHDSSAALAEYSRQKKLFVIQPPSRRALRPSWSAELSSQLDALDATLRESTRGRWDLATVAGAVTLGLSFKQLLEGALLPPAWTLFSQTIQLLYGVEEKGGRRAARKRKAAGLRPL